jgi:hypothetical protein
VWGSRTAARTRPGAHVGGKAASRSAALIDRRTQDEDYAGPGCLHRLVACGQLDDLTRVERVCGLLGFAWRGSRRSGHGRCNIVVVAARRV